MGVPYMGVGWLAIVQVDQMGTNLSKSIDKTML